MEAVLLCLAYNPILTILAAAIYCLINRNCANDKSSVSHFDSHRFPSTYSDVPPFNLHKQAVNLTNQNSSCFLDRLPRLAKEDLSDNNICLICQEQYETPHSDSEPGEEAVRCLAQVDIQSG